MAWEYGPSAAGAFSVWTASFKAKQNSQIIITAYEMVQDVQILF